MVYEDPIREYLINEILKNIIFISLDSKKEQIENKLIGDYNISSDDKEKLQKELNILKLDLKKLSSNDPKYNKLIYRRFRSNIEFIKKKINENKKDFEDLINTYISLIKTSESDEKTLEHLKYIKNQLFKYISTVPISNYDDNIDVNTSELNENNDDNSNNDLIFNQNDEKIKELEDKINSISDDIKRISNNQNFYNKQSSSFDDKDNSDSNISDFTDSDSDDDDKFKDNMTDDKENINDFDITKNDDDDIDKNKDYDEDDIDDRDDRDDRDKELKKKLEKEFNDKDDILKKINERAQFGGKVENISKEFSLNDFNKKYNINDEKSDDKKNKSDEESEEESEEEIEKDDIKKKNKKTKKNKNIENLIGKTYDDEIQQVSEVQNTILKLKGNLSKYSISLTKLYEEDLISISETNKVNFKKSIEYIEKQLKNLLNIPKISSDIFEKKKENIEQLKLIINNVVKKYFKNNTFFGESDNIYNNINNIRKNTEDFLNILQNNKNILNNETDSIKYIEEFDNSIDNLKEFENNFKKIEESLEEINEELEKYNNFIKSTENEYKNKKKEFIEQKRKEFREKEEEKRQEEEREDQEREEEKFKDKENNELNFDNDNDDNNENFKEGGDYDSNTNFFNQGYNDDIEIKIKKSEDYKDFIEELNKIIKNKYEEFFNNSELKNKIIKKEDIDKIWKNYKYDIYDKIYKKILEVQKNISNKYKTEEININTEDGNNVKYNLYSIDNIFNKIFNKYENDIKNKNKIRNVIEDEFYNEVKSNDLNPDKVLEISLNDKIIFIVLIFAIRQISLLIVDFLINNNLVYTLGYMLIAYNIIYLSILFIFIIWINLDDYKMRILFNFLNFHINSFAVFSHISLVIILSIIIYYYIYNSDSNIRNSSNKILSELEKIEYKHKLDTITLIIFIFTSLFDYLV